MKNKLLLIPLLTLLAGSAVSLTFIKGNGSDITTQVLAVQHEDNFDPYSYSGSYYNSLSSSLSDGLNGTLRTDLTKLIFPKAFYKYSGTGSGTLSEIFQKCDEDPTNSKNMIYLYTRDSVKKNAASTWNREHVWPKSLSNGCWEESNAGTDCLHIRPTYSSTNSKRGNLKYGGVSGSYLTYNGMDYGKATSGYFEPLDSVKGDVARIIMYTWVAYKEFYGSKLPNITNVFQSYDVMMQWHLSDKPDALEGKRNDVVETSKQKNRNPFVDHPEYAWKIFGSNCSASVLASAKETYPESTNPVEDIKLQSLSLDKTELTLQKNDKVNVNLTYNPANATNKSVIWSSSDEDVAKVDNGLITAIKEGKTTIKVTSVENSFISASIEVIVTKHEEEKQLSRLEVDEGNTTIKPNEEYVFNGKVYAVYEDGTKEEVTNYQVTTELKDNDHSKIKVTITYSENGEQRIYQFYVNKAQAGCRGNIIFTSGLVSFLSLLGISLILIRKRKFN